MWERGENMKEVKYVSSILDDAKRKKE